MLWNRNRVAAISHSRAKAKGRDGCYFRRILHSNFLFCLPDLLRRFVDALRSPNEPGLSDPGFEQRKIIGLAFVRRSQRVDGCTARHAL